MVKYKPGDKFEIKIEEAVYEDKITGDILYKIANVNRRFWGEELDMLIDAMAKEKGVTKENVEYNLGYTDGYADGVVAENERIRNLLFSFKEKY